MSSGSNKGEILHKNDSDPKALEWEEREFTQDEDL